MLIILNFCVSNVINHIIEKLYLKKKVDAKIDFHFDEMLLFMSLIINKFLDEQNLFLYIQRMIFSILFFINLFFSIIRGFVSYLY